ncbi:TcaA second domain-containing protein [Thermaerobacillus caldiproteolyticus]|uniref:TcaA second domain-containing protein n=1 Tax=Thermaerobacillus caldiproteolyticus TaxID=247480 RepID=UPI00188CB896|nr:hypothetical protein [Anoxybacillus caldiproteolyticus]QPA32861.1 hypothetical protein ISX45_08175 [Anoxybacillus caldiproteolyticus]
MKQHVKLDTNTDGTKQNGTKEVSGGEVAVQARYEQRRRARLLEHERRKVYYRMAWRVALVIAALWLIGTLFVKGYGALKNAAGKEVAMMRFEQALKEKDIAALQTYIRIPDPTIPVNEKTLAPLFVYLESHPKAYETIHHDLEKQWKTKHVYIKGLTSQPPIFSMKVYEKQFFLFNQYVFEPTLYSLVIHAEGENVTILVNGKKVQGEPQKEPFSRKLGSYLPGVYEVTIVRKEGEKTTKETKKIVLFGGKRVHEVDF